MKYHVLFSKKAKKKLSKMDPSAAAYITKWLRKNVEGSTDPRRHGKALTADHSGEWRYRVGSYRILAEIIDDQIIVLVIDVGHRREIYRQ